MLITYQFRNMPQGRSNSFEGWIADGGVPVADSHERAPNVGQPAFDHT